MLKSWKTSKDKKKSQTAPIKWRKWWRSPKLTVSRNREVLLKLAPQQWMMVFKNYKERMAMGSSNTNAGIVYSPRLTYILRVRTRARAEALAPRHVWRFFERQHVAPDVSCDHISNDLHTDLRRCRLLASLCVRRRSEKCDLKMQGKKSGVLSHPPLFYSGDWYMSFCLTSLTRMSSAFVIHTFCLRCQ